MEQRTALEHEARVLGTVDLGAGQVGRQQVRRELHPVKVALDSRREFLHRGRLGEPRRALHEQVAVGQQGDEEPIDEGVLADDSRAERVANPDERALRRR